MNKPVIKILNQVIIIDISNNKSLIPCMLSMCRSLTTFEIYRVGKQKRLVTKMSGKYYHRNKESTEIRVSINCIHLVLNTFAKNGVPRENVEIIDTRDYTIDKLNVKLSPSYTARTYQKRYIWSISGPKAGRSHLVDLEMGYGKASPLDSLVRIPNDWKKMRDVKIGDTVIASDGTKTKVIAVHPQGKLDIYKLTFSDGRVHECCGEHLWEVYHEDFEEKKRVINTLEVIKLLEKQNPENKSTFIDLVIPEQNEDKKYFIHPYVMGVILGDGGASHDLLGLTLSYRDIVIRTRKYLNDRGAFKKKNGSDIQHSSTIKERLVRKFMNKQYVKELEKYQLLKTKTYEKFIPKDYLNGSEKQRYELLRGLMDTEGDVGEEGQLTYSTFSEKLMLDVVELIRSLGGIATVEVKELPKSPYQKSVNKKSYRVSIQMRNPLQCVTIKHKMGERLKSINKYPKTLKLGIEKIEYIEKKEAQCITIDHPRHLYVAGDYVVTHNSLIGSYAVVRNNYKTALLTKSGYLEKWVDDIKKYIIINDDEIFYIQGSDSIKEIVNMEEKDRDKIKFYLMSMRTMQNYIESFKENPNNVPIHPSKLLPLLKIGTILNDESHQEFTSLFKIILYIDPKKLIGLSATMISDDPKINYMYELLYPVRDRASNLVEYVKYINVKTYGYRLEKFRLVYKTSMGYNHILFEKSIMQNAKALKDYVEMVLYYIEHEYLKYKKDSDKCLLFFASVDMCTLMTRQVKLKYPKLVVKRYVEKDPYENVLTADVCVSTNKSAGTAVDIPKLITTIQTVSISGTQPNKQSAGRLREIDDKEVRYICLYSTDLKIHVKMNAKRYKALIDIFKTYSSDGYRKVIGRPFEK